MVEVNTLFLAMNCLPQFFCTFKIFCRFCFLGLIQFLKVVKVGNGRINYLDLVGNLERAPSRN